MAIKGIIDSRGRVTIAWDSQAEVLAAPDGKKYLPCDSCGKVHAVEMNTVCFLCKECADLKSNGIERCQICKVPDGKNYTDPRHSHLIAIVEHQYSGAFYGATICQLCREHLEVRNV